MIRRAEERDIPEIMRLLLQVNMVHHLGRPDLFRGPATKYSADEVRALLSEEKQFIYAWTDAEDRMRGYAFCVLQVSRVSNLMQDRRTLYIDDLCVDEKARGQHIGTDLYRHVLQEAKGLGCDSVTLNVWTCNPSAMRFYESLGLKPLKVTMEQTL